VRTRGRGAGRQGWRPAWSSNSFEQLKHFQGSVGCPAGQVTQSCRPQPGQEMRTRSGAPFVVVSLMAPSVSVSADSGASGAV